MFKQNNVSTTSWTYASTNYFIIFAIYEKMAVEAINLGYVDEVWIVPCGDRKDKKINVSGAV